MLNLSICIFGVTYIIKGKLALVVGSTHCKPFGEGSKKNLSHFFKFDCTGHVDRPKIS